MASHNNYLRFSMSFCLYLFLSFLVAEVFSQQGLIAQKYYTIVPGISTRTDVERLFPLAKSGEFYKAENVVEFQQGEIAMRVEYSTGKCGDSLPDYGTFPKWTVVGVSYDWPDDNQILLMDVILDVKKFKRGQTSDVDIIDNYSNESCGVNITYNTKLKSVDGIYLEPTSSLKTKYGKCK